MPRYPPDPGWLRPPGRSMVRAMAQPDTAIPAKGALVFRQRLSTRLWHWVNAAALVILLMSGLMIFNAHPRLYWGEYGANFDTAWLEIGATASDRGLMRIGPVRVETTGVLGVFTAGDGTVRRDAFPGWATIPATYNLAAARIWHLAFAWVLATGLLLYLVWSLVNGHIRRDLHITRREWAPAALWQDVRAHLRLPLPLQTRYNTLQKIAYAAVLFGLLPVMIATGLAMSPAMDAAWPWLSAVWGGRQSARSIHFIAAFALVAFVIVHIAMVVLAGPLNGLRSMITGWHRGPAE